MKTILISFMNVLSKEIKNNISETSLVLVLITLPLDFAVNSLSIILFFLVGCYKAIIKKDKIVFNNLNILFFSFYLVCLLSLLWTGNYVNTKNGLSRFLPYLILPLAFAFNNISILKEDYIFNFFSRSLVCFTFYSFIEGIIKYYLNSDINYMFYHKLSGNLNNMNAIYLSVYTSFGVIFFLMKKRKSKLDFFSLFFLSFFLILLSSKMIISFTFLVLMIFYFRKRRVKIINFKKLIIILGITLVFLFAFSNVFNRIKVEICKTKISEVLTKKEFSSVYLWTGTGLRLFQIKVFVEIISEQEKCFLGLGLNNSQNSLNKKYVEYKLYSGFSGYNFHNQYIQVFAELGIAGTFILCLILFSVLKKAIKTNNYLLLSFIMLILVVCLTESFLWRQRGMVFFITIVLLFNTRKKVYN